MFNYGQCSYKSKRKYDVGRDEKAMHGDFKKNYMVNHGNDGGIIMCKVTKMSIMS